MLTFEAMKFIQRYDINTSKWDALVQKSEGLCYQYAWYLDATAKNWGVYVNEDYSKGVALAYNEILGKRILYPLLFGRTLEFFGMNLPEIEILVEQLKLDFPIGQIQLPEALKQTAQEVRTFQSLHELKLNKLSKRMLQKAEKHQLKAMPIPWRESVYLVEQELGPKVSMMRGENLNRLNALLAILEERNMLHSIGIFDEEKCQGVLYMVRDGKRFLYLKGAATVGIKEQGGMYLAMKQQIEFALGQGLIFDFGGSSVPGIKRFFAGFGGEDQHYWVYQWNKAPFWFNWLRKINKVFK